MLDTDTLAAGRDSSVRTLLRRSLGTWQVVSLVVSSMVGTGVFIRPASMLQDVGSVPLLLLAWLVGGLISLVPALCYAELATLMPEAGGEYVYLRTSFGELPAFMFGWMRFVVGAGIAATLSVAVAIFLSDLIPLQGEWWRWRWRLG